MIGNIQKVQQMICGETPPNVERGTVTSFELDCHSFFGGSIYKTTVSNNTLVNKVASVSNHTVMSNS
jgi:hypothetical protein